MADEKVKAEADRMRGWLHSGGVHNGTVTKEVLREIYLAGADLMCHGYLRTIKSRHLGAGVYKVWTAKWVEEKP